MPGGLLNVLLLVPIFLFSLCFHEYAHAWVAQKLGDPTARLRGRLTMHPMAHADILGTLILPSVCIYFGAPFFGWAKPVPVDARYFANPRRDFALVAVAGPMANILLSLISTLLLAGLLRVPLNGIPTWIETLQTFTAVSIQVNLMLAFFNLIPIPPLDGFNILQGILPEAAAIRMARFTRYANLLLFALLFTGGFRVIALPVVYCSRWLLTFAGITGS